jgi:prephenate dehydratase
MYKCNEQRTITSSPQVYKECGKYIIQGKSAFMGVVVLSKSQAERIWREMGKLIGKVDWKHEMEKDKNRYLRNCL